MGIFRICGAALIFAVMLMAAVFPVIPGRGGASAEEETPWHTAAEAEEARAAAEAKAREIAQDAAKKTAAAEKAEEEAEKAAEAAEEAAAALDAARKAAESAAPEKKAEAERKLGEAEDALREAKKEVQKWGNRAKKAREAAEQANQELAEAAMELKAATEASVRMANAEMVDSSRIAASFRLGERYSGRFNDDGDPIYLHFLMDHDAKVRVSTQEGTVSISVLDSGGTTILTLVPSTGGAGSVCSLAEGEYILMVARMGTGKNISISLSEYQGDADGKETEWEDPEDDETEMVTLVEFD